MRNRPGPARAGAGAAASRSENDAARQPQKAAAERRSGRRTTGCLFISSHTPSTQPNSSVDATLPCPRDRREPATGRARGKAKGSNRELKANLSRVATERPRTHAHKQTGPLHLPYPPPGVQALARVGRPKRTSPPRTPPPALRPSPPPASRHHVTASSPLYPLPPLRPLPSARTPLPLFHPYPPPAPQHSTPPSPPPRPPLLRAP